jgi:hypothetical protein
MHQYKIINKTNQSIQLISGTLRPRESIVVKEISEQISSLEKKGLITIKIIK